MKAYHFFSCCICLSLVSVSWGQSKLITFDDLSAVGFGDSTPNLIPNGYQGLDWVNFYVANTSDFPQSGILNGTVSTPNVAGTPGSPINSPIISSISASTPFILVSGYFTSAFLNGMSLQITGINGATTAFNETFTLNVTGPSFLTFPADALTEVDFTPSGGSLPGPGYLPGGSEMVLDNLTIAPVPEPSSCAMIFCGTALLTVLHRRKK